MLTKLSKILSDKFWAATTELKKKQLFQLLIIWIIIGGITLSALIVNLFFTSFNGCLPCSVISVAISVLAIFCILNGKKSCAVSLVFSIPIILYGYYIAQFSSHPSPIETIHYTTWWLIGGLLYLYFFAEKENKIILFFFISLAFTGYQLYAGGHLSDSFSYFTPVVTNPLLIIAAFFFPTFYLRKKFVTTVEKLESTLQANSESVNKVLQNSSFMISRITAERDEGGNIEKLLIDKVNNAFESAFKLNLYEVQGQEADYVFNLIFKGQLDINNILFFSKKSSTELHDKNTDRWFKIQILNPSYNLYYLIFEDITKTKKQIADLEASKRRYKVLLEAIPDIFFVIDKDGIYEDFVIKEGDLFKMEDANIIGSSIFKAGFPDNMANKIYSCIQHCIKANSIESIEYSMNTPNGTFFFEMRLAKLNEQAVISVARDITKRKTAEFGLEKAKNKAEESTRLKSAFLANLSHEIKTPMNIITNFTRMLADPDLTGYERMEFTDAITENGKQLLNMIDNTVHLSKIETQSVSIQNSFCKVNSLVRDIYNEFSPNIPDTKNVRINLSLDVATPEFGFETDNNLLKEALTILLDNAVKYTLNGVVTFGFEMIRNDEIKFIINDTGIGIPKEEFENIFSRFYRIPNHINETTSGSGIGLSIAQHYISLMGGELQFTSTVDKGSQFWFTLPFKAGKGYMKIVN